jgi:hypothetical protein
MPEFRDRAMDDIGVGIPAQMLLPVDPDLQRDVVQHACVTRREGLQLARHEIAKDRDSTLKTVLTLLQVLVIPRTEEYLAQSLQQGLKIECSPGCKACCYQGVEVSIPEAILVALQVADPADPRRAAILETAAKVDGLELVDRVRSRLPCPLLVDNKCSVYEDRPLLCRATLSPCAAGCYQALLHNNAESLQIHVVPQFFAVADKDALRGICKDLGLQHGNVELVQAVAAILHDPTIVIRWAAGDQVFATLLPATVLPEIVEPSASALRL